MEKGGGRTEVDGYGVTSLSFVQSDTLDTVMKTVDDEEVLEEGNDEEETNKVFQILDKMENGQILDESLPSRAAHRNRTIRFVRYGCTGKTPVPSRLQIYKLTAVIFTAVNRIETVNFSRITALYGYTGG